MYKLGRFWRTVRHLNREQVIYRIINRGKRVYYRFSGRWENKRLRNEASTLPDPDCTRPQFVDAAEFMRVVQQEKYGDKLDDIRKGSFTILNRTVAFGSVEQVEWRRNLGEDNNPLWRMNLAYMGYAVPLLATGAEDDLAVVGTLIESLEQQNPLNGTGVFRDVWFSYAVSHRIINLLCGLALWVKTSGAQDRSRVAPVVSHVKFCVLLLRRNLERELQFNHLFKNLLALRTYEAAIPSGNDLELVTNDYLLAVLEQQILPDGGHIERSPMYHVLFLQDIRLLRTFTWASPEIAARLAAAETRAIHALGTMTHSGNERIALMNDAWFGEAMNPRCFLGESEAIPDRSISILKDAGYGRVRVDGWSLIFDCGAAGPDSNLGHAHADFLSVELMYERIPVLVDPGTPIYTAGRLRDWSRSASAHNGPALHGIEPLEFWKSFRVGRRGYAHWLDTRGPQRVQYALAGYQTGYAHVGCIPARFVAIEADGILVVDGWRFNDVMPQPLINWVVSDAWTVTRDARNIALQGANAEIRWDFYGEPLVEIDDGNYYEEFGLRKAGTKVTVYPTIIDGWAFVGSRVSIGGWQSDSDHWHDTAEQMIVSLKKQIKVIPCRCID